MTVFDIVVIGVVLLSGVFAYSRGFVREALSIGAWVLAAFAAFYAFPYLVPPFERILPKGVIAEIAAAATIFIVALIVLHIVAKALAGHVKRSALSPIDRTLGLAFGLLRGLVLVCLGYIALAWALPAGDHRPGWFGDSRTLPYLDAAAEWLEHYFSRPRASGPGHEAINVEKEAERAIGAFTNPASNPKPTGDDQPAYTPNEQRDFNRLIEQQNAH